MTLAIAEAVNTLSKVQLGSSKWNKCPSELAISFFVGSMDETGGTAPDY